MCAIKRLDKTDNKTIFDLSQFAFQYKLTAEELKKKEEEAARHIVWGYMDGENIAAKLHLIPLTCLIGGKSYSVGGISSVATWPEYRRQGMVKQLFSHALKHMKESGQTVSYLHPFSFRFYRKLGWEYMFNQKSYSIPVSKMSGNWKGQGYVRRSAPDYIVLNNIYTDYAKQFSGTLLRDEAWWKQRIFKQVDQLAIAYNNQNSEEAYVHYRVKEDVLTVHDMAYRNVNGLHLLMNFIGNHDSMVEKIEMKVPENDPLPELVHEPTFKQEIKPYFMVRIVDVLGFLNSYPFQPTTTPSKLSIAVEDSFFPENEGVYYLWHDGVEVDIEFVKANGKLNSQESDIQSTIQQVAQLFMGYKTALYLKQVGLIEGQAEHIEKLTEWLPRQQTYYPDADFF